MAAPFPSPSLALVAVLDELRLAAASPPTTKKELDRLATLPRPWDPAACPHELRTVIYIWLDDVAAWINEEHTWRVDRMIPICWTQHPHIVHELGTLASVRWEASYAITPDALENWHHYALPLFLERIAQQIGSTGCPPGRHQPQPGDSRNTLYRDTDEVVQRRRRRVEDSA
jgi:hypothetical protein